jgi:hypothetical protein
MLYFRYGNYTTAKNICVTPYMHTLQRKYTVQCDQFFNSFTFSFQFCLVVIFKSLQGGSKRKLRGLSGNMTLGYTLQTKKERINILIEKHIGDLNSVYMSSPVSKI